MTRIALATGLALVAFSFAVTPVLAQQGVRGGGPPFCQNGQGHPVHGWGWCVSKGWAPAHHGPTFLRGWEMLSWDDARFRHRRPVRYDQWLGEGDLVSIIGDVVLRRVAGEGRARGHTEPARARWVQQGLDGFALEVRAGNTPIAYLHDSTRDGRVDRVYLRPRR